MDEKKRKIIGQGILGLILIVISLKYSPFLFNLLDQHNEISDKPAILFFNEVEPCECMLELTEQAEQQVSNWSSEQLHGIPIVHIAFQQRKDLEIKYKVFRVPSLLLIDHQDQIIWRQDYPLIEGGPFKLDELEGVIAALYGE